MHAQTSNGARKCESMSTFVSLKHWNIIKPLHWLHFCSCTAVTSTCITQATAVWFYLKPQLTSSRSFSPQSLLSRSLLRGRGHWSTGLSGKAPTHSWTACPCPRPRSPRLRDGCSDDPWALSALQTMAFPSLSWWAECRSRRPAGGGQDPLWRGVTGWFRVREM